MTRFDVTSIGEGQLRLNTETGTALEEVRALSVSVAGTEGNVLGLLSRLGNRTGLVTCLPSTPLGRRVLNEYRSGGVDTGAIVWRDGGRVALYFVEHASAPVPTRVIFDRAASCFAQLGPDEVDWAYVADSRLLHVTGITAALGGQPCRVVERAVQQARQAGQPISIDVNHRTQLWSAEEARERLSPLLREASVISCSRRDAETLFGHDGDAAAVGQSLAAQFGAGAVLVSNGPQAAAVVAEGRTLSAVPPATEVIDRVGAGDALVAGFLHGWLRGDAELGLRLGIAAAALALTRVGDQVLTSLPELEQLSTSLGRDIVR